MKRKLIKQGGGGLTFYVPKKWASKRGLKGGDEIDITEVENKLLISSEMHPEKRETELEITSENEHFIRLTLNALYRLGYDRIKVFIKDKSQASHIKKTSENFFGFDVTEEKENFIVIENIGEPSDEKKETIFRRMFLLIAECIELISNDLKKGKYGNLASIKELNHKMNVYNNFCRRIISKNMFMEESIYFHWNLYARLLVIQHSTYHFYKLLTQNQSSKASKHCLKIIETIKKDYNNIYSGFFKKDLGMIRKSNESLRKLLFNSVLDKIKKSKGMESATLYYLGELSRTIYLLTTPMLAILLNEKNLFQAAKSKT